MARSIQIRNVPDGVHSSLRARAFALGLSLSDYLLQEITRVAERPPIADVLARASGRSGGASTSEIVDAVRSGREHTQVLVVDTSAVVSALTGRPQIPDLHEHLTSDGDLHAPHLIDVELIHALRRLVRRGTLSEDRAQDCRTDFADLTLTRYPHEPLADRMWELRHNLGAYDAAYVALSEALDVPLVTCDVHLSEAPGHDASIELFTP